MEWDLDLVAELKDWVGDGESVWDAVKDIDKVKDGDLQSRLYADSENDRDRVADEDELGGAVRYGGPVADEMK